MKLIVTTTEEMEGGERGSDEMTEEWMLACRSMHPHLRSVSLPGASFTAGQAIEALDHVEKSDGVTKGVVGRTIGSA